MKLAAAQRRRRDRAGYGTPTGITFMASLTAKIDCRQKFCAKVYFRVQNRRRGSG